MAIGQTPKGTKFSTLRGTVPTDVRMLKDIALEVEKVDAADPMVDKYLEAYDFLTQERGLREDSPLTLRELRRALEIGDARRTVKANPPPDYFVQRAPIHMGRMIKSMTQGARAAAINLAADAQARLPRGISLEDAAAGQTVPRPGAFASEWGGPVAEMQAGMQAMDPELQSRAARALDVRDRALAPYRAEHDLYSQGLEAMDPIMGPLVGALPLAMTPMGGGFALTAARTAGGGRAAADIAISRGAPTAGERAMEMSAKTGLQIGAREAPLAGAQTAMEYTPEDRSKAQDVLMSMAFAGTLPVITDKARGIVYRWKNGGRLTEQERAMVLQEQMERNGMQAVQDAARVGPPAPGDAEDVDTLLTNIFGDSFMMPTADMARNLTDEEIRVLTPTQAQRLSMFRSFGVEPMRWQVLRETGYDEAQEAAILARTPSDIPERMGLRAIQERQEQAPIRALAGQARGLPRPGEAGPALREALAGRMEEWEAGVSEMYRIARQASDDIVAQGGAKERITPVRVYNLLGQTYDDKNLFQGTDAASRFGALVRAAKQGQMPNVAQLFDEFGAVIKQANPERLEDFAKIDTKLAKMRKDGASPQEIELERFRLYSNVSQGMTASEFEEMRKTVNRYWRNAKGGEREMLGYIKDAMDDDIVEELGVDVFRGARLAHRERMETMKRLPVIGKVLDEYSTISDEQMFDKLYALPEKDLRSLFDVMKTGSDEQKEAAQYALDAMRSEAIYRLSMAMRSQYQADASGMQKLNMRGYITQLNKLLGGERGSSAGKLRLLLGDETYALVRQVPEYYRLMQSPAYRVATSNPSNTAASIFARASVLADKLESSGVVGIPLIGKFLRAAIEESPQAQAARVMRRQGTAVAPGIVSDNAALARKREMIERNRLYGGTDPMVEALMLSGTRGVAMGVPYPDPNAWAQQVLMPEPVPPEAQITPPMLPPAR